jgi:DNA-binding GntR family transcriptional regulator
MAKETNSLSAVKGDLKELVISHVRERIFEKNILRCGDQINERELSRTLGVSRAPIREALKELEEQGLIVSVKYKGWFVADFMEQEFFEINKLRTLLEHSLLEAIILQGVPEKELLRAETLNAELDEIVERTEPGEKKAVEFAEKEMEFHRCLHSLPRDCFWTKKMLRNLSYQIQCSFHRWLYKEWQMKASVETHRMLLQCLKDRDMETLYKLLSRRLGKYHLVSPEEMPERVVVAGETAAR